MAERDTIDRKKGKIKERKRIFCFSFLPPSVRKLVLIIYPGNVQVECGSKAQKEKVKMVQRRGGGLPLNPTPVFIFFPVSLNLFFLHSCWLYAYRFHGGSFVPAPVPVLPMGTSHPTGDKYDVQSQIHWKLGKREGGRDGGEAESTQQLMASLSIGKADKIIKRKKKWNMFSHNTHSWGLGGSNG